MMIYKTEKKYKRRNRKGQINIPICTASVLLCLTLLTTHFIGGIYARYTIKGQSFDSAKSISYGALNITETGDFVDGNNMMIIPGVNIDKKATVNFEGSESASYIFLEVSVSPSGRWNKDSNDVFSLKLDNKEILSWHIRDNWIPLTDIANGRYIFYQHLESNTVLKEDIIEDALVTINDTLTNNDMKALNNIGNINIKFRATAVQSIGFNSPANAWESISN